MPTPLLLMAPRIPATRVPCQELSEVGQPANSGFFRSALDIQSPGSEASGLRPSPVFPVGTELIMSYPASRRLAVVLRRSG